MWRRGIMKGIRILIALCITASAVHTSFASFFQRYGANSHITNLPVFLKNSYYDDRKTKKRKEAKEVKVIINNKKVKQNVSNKQSYRSKRKEINATFAKMKVKQNELERTKQRLENEIAELESRKYEMVDQENEDNQTSMAIS